MNHHFLLFKYFTFRDFFYRNSLFEEKRRLEQRINQLEEEVEEEQNNVEILTVNNRKNTLLVSHKNITANIHPVVV